MKETAVRFGSKKGQEAHPASEKALRAKVRKGLSTLVFHVFNNPKGLPSKGHSIQLALTSRALAGSQRF